MATFDELVTSALEPGEEILLRATARRLPFDRRRGRGADAVLTDAALAYVTVTSHMIYFGERRKLSKATDPTSVRRRSIISIEQAVRPRPHLQKQAVRLQFDDGATATLELPSKDQAELLLKALAMARRHQSTYDPLRAATLPESAAR
ncbi:MAG: hypothetical protein GX868_15470 [Actinobacteria bacterium]|nr:hypothetical protein [Actinomycetota bacterium]